MPLQRQPYPQQFAQPYAYPKPDLTDHTSEFEKDDVKLFITSGLSAPKGLIPRLNNPPEIAVVDVDGLSREQM